MLLLVQGVCALIGLGRLQPPRRLEIRSTPRIQPDRRPRRRRLARRAPGRAGAEASRTLLGAGLLEASPDARADDHPGAR